MYAQDFAPAKAVYEPTSDGLMLGLPPLLILFLVVLLLAAGVAGWVLGRRPQPGTESAAAAIWKAVDDAIRGAMTAHSDAIADRANALRRVIDGRLGKTLALSSGFAGLADLDRALGRASDAHDHDDHGHGNGDGHGHGTAEHPPHDDAHAPEDEAHATPGIHIERASRVVIHQPPTPRPGHRPPPARPSSPPQTEAQRRDAIRKAVSDLNDHWRLKDARINEIKAAHAELSGRKA